FIDAGVAEYKNAIPLVITTKKKEDGSGSISILKASRWKDFHINSEILSIDVNQGEVHVTENLTIKVTDNSNKLITLVLNPQHILIFSLDEGTWKIKEPFLKTINFPKKEGPENNHMGLYFSKEGIGLIMIKPYIELVLSTKEGSPEKSHIALRSSELKIGTKIKKKK
ncbi:hypothetical protein ACFLT9_14205, partial [Acidobacteriota bacterium]